MLLAATLDDYAISILLTICRTGNVKFLHDGGRGLSPWGYDPSENILKVLNQSEVYSAGPRFALAKSAEFTAGKLNFISVVIDVRFHLA